jgi:predicted tellurium resistance membrane protein TerC
MLSWLVDPNVWAALLALTAMEIVLGIDNVVFISLLVAKLDPRDTKRARAIGLLMAFVFRVAMLVLLNFFIGLTQPIFSLFDHPVSWRDVILSAGGLFLVWKATYELHADAEHEGRTEIPTPPPSFAAAIAQIAVIDFVFSIDSIVTAIGMAQQLEIMVLAIILSMIAMYAASAAIAQFIQMHPTTKVLALAFLLLIGTSLIADGSGFHMPRGYLYFAMAFAGAIEAYNVFLARRRGRR